MTIGDALFTWAVAAVIMWGAWLRHKGHKHKWRETSREQLVRQRDKAILGYRSYCVCEECGRPEYFNLYDDSER
jgi:hypothetical protein